MLTVLKMWFDKYFSHPEAVYLTAFLFIAVIIFKVFGSILVPILAGIIISYMLLGFVRRLTSWKIPHLLAVLIVYALFVGILLLIVIWLFPILLQQLANFFAEIPRFITVGNQLLLDLQVKHPDIFSADQLKSFLTEFSVYLTKMGQVVLSYSLASIGNVITVIVYLILVPLLVFFFLKDDTAILSWLKRFVPKDNLYVTKIWNEVNAKIGDYIRGKIVEIFIVTLVSLLAFVLMRLNYAVLLAVCVGLSVIIPYVGAIVVTIPVVIVAMIEWGLCPHFAYLLVLYAIIITLDANLLVPILFSETMKLHPVVIMLAVLFFGSLWGFWGVFFAIPLATLVNALIKGWPRAAISEK